MDLNVDLSCHIFSLIGPHLKHMCTAVNVYMYVNLRNACQYKIKMHAKSVSSLS